MPECMSCFQLFTPSLDQCLCDACVTEAYRHKPEQYMRIKLLGGSSYIQPLHELAQALLADVDGAEPGQKWELELIEMSRAEYEALPEFRGH